MDGYSARRCGSTGHEILNPDGEVIAWTVDGRWAEAIVALLNTTEVSSPPLPEARPGAAAQTNGETRPPTPRYP
jgi:hypothetical protein